MTDVVRVDYHRLDATADHLQQMACALSAMVPRLAADAARAGLHELMPYGIFGGVPVAADLMAMCLPGNPASLPDAAAELLALSVSVRAAGVAYLAVDGARWARAELPTAQALVMLAVWNRLHLAVRVTACATGTGSLGGAPAVLLDRAGESLLEDTDRWIEGDVTVREVAPASMRPLGRSPAAGLGSLLGVVNTMTDVHHPSTVALLRVGDDPPRYVLCLPGLQDPTGADASAADLPGAIATLTGHSAYIRGMRSLLRTLPAGSQVLLVGHSQGGMVAEALAEHPRVGQATIAGVLTAGAPVLATPVPPDVPYLALENVADPVPRLGRLAGAFSLGSLDRPSSARPVRFRSPGPWPSDAKHGLFSGGYVTKADSDDPRVTAFGERVAGFTTDRPVDVRFLAVTDSDAPPPAKGVRP